MLVRKYVVFLGKPLHFVPYKYVSYGISSCSEVAIAFIANLSRFFTILTSIRTASFIQYLRKIADWLSLFSFKFVGLSNYFAGDLGFLFNLELDITVYDFFFPISSEELWPSFRLINKLNSWWNSQLYNEPNFDI